jgi:FemAB-related protein (PEP-CTERM system-associated)
MTLEVERFAGSAEEWDGFVRGRSGWSPFHLFGWKRIIEDVHRHECVYLGVRAAAGALEGVLPLVRMNSALFGHYLVSMPYVNYGGPLGSAPAIEVLVKHASDLARQGRVKLLELRSRIELPIDLVASHRKVTVVLDLPPDVETLRKSLGAKLRSQIKRPEKEGVTVTFGPEQVDPFYEIFARHMRDLGTPTQPRALFRAIGEAFGRDVWFGCAYLNGRPVAAGAGFRWGAEFEMTWASSLTEFNPIAPNMLLYWSFMERAVREGLSLFNFGRCTPNSGTHRFKRQWGSRDETLWWYQWSTAPGASTPSPDEGAYAWGARLWKRLPVPLATTLGPSIVRGIP